MSPEPDVATVVSALHLSIGQLMRRLRQAKRGDEVTLPESHALARLDRSGPSTVADMARVAQISPQSMGTTLASLEARGLVARAPDPHDGRRIVLSLTDAGREVVRTGRNARIELLSDAIAQHFTPAERAQLLAVSPLFERLAKTI